MATRRELIAAVATRYRAASREVKKEILDEFVKVTGFHRKHAIRVLKKSPKQGGAPASATAVASVRRGRAGGIDDRLGSG